MPIDYEVDENQHLVLTTFHGHVTADEIMAHTLSFVNDKRIAPNFSQLVDTQEIESTDATSINIWGIARITASSGFLKDGKTAIVANKDTHFGLSRMYQSFSEKWRPGIVVFRTMKEAKSWLSITDEQ